MISFKLADIAIAVDNKYSYIENMCRNYLCTDAPLMDASVTEEEILREQTAKGQDMGYLESLAVYRKISQQLPCENAFLMHGAVIDVDGEGIAFLAKSGVGKTTHMLNWGALLGDRMKVINGDKPIVRVTRDGVYAYGTPWSGKENMHTNSRTKLKALCYIQRGDTNHCYRDDDISMDRLSAQVYRPEGVDAFLKTVELMYAVRKNVAQYVIECNTNISSAEVAYNEIFK